MMKVTTSKNNDIIEELPMNLNKTLISDKRNLISDAIPNGEWMRDYDLDENLVYIEKFDEEDNTFKTFKHSFTMTDTKVEIAEDGVAVIRKGEYVEIEQDTDKSFVTEIISAIDKHFGSPKRATPEVNVIKQFDADEMFAIEPLYVAPGEADGHKETMDLDGITGMVDSLNKANDEGRLQSGLFHKHKTDTWSLDKAWVNPTECMIGDTLVPEGQPIAKTIFTNKAAYELRVNGDISGLSIGARAKEIVEIAKDLSSIQSKVEPTHIIKGAHFDWDHPELTYTSPSQGGAASLKNDAYQLNKAKKAVEADLDSEQAQILKDIGEEFISLEKHLGTDNNQTPSPSADAEVKVGEEPQVTKGSNDMSENTVTREEFQELQKALAVSKAVNSIAGYSFETEINKDLAEAIASLSDENKEAVNKALDVLVTRGKEAIDKAIEKSKTEKVEDENELSKSLSEEVGESGEPEAPVEKSLAMQARDHQDAIQKGAK